MKRLQLYLRESYNELVHKVSWPTWSNLMSSGIVVVTTTLLLTLLIALFDVSFNGIMNLIYGL